MRKLIKSLLPSSAVTFIRYFKQRCRMFTAKVKILFSIPLKKKPAKIRFEINLAEHCNLNCYGCSNFSCIAKPELVDIDEFRRDMSRMGEIFGHECERIYLIGGEPLLNPNVPELMRIARENFTCGDIFLFTNGILLSKQDAKFWESCRDNSIAILMSAYPIKLDIESLRNTAATFGVSVEWAWNQNDGERDTFSIQTIDLEGRNDARLNFAMCGRALNCITLKHGRLFTCTFAPHVEHFNKRFGQNVSITEADYVDIYRNNDPDDILRRLAQPIPACRYCDKVHPPKQVKWQHTKQEIGEWLSV